MGGILYPIKQRTRIFWNFKYLQPVYYKDVLENVRQILVQLFTISRQFSEIRNRFRKKFMGTSFGQISRIVWKMFLNFEFGSTCMHADIHLPACKKSESLTVYDKPGRSKTRAGKRLRRP